MKGSIEEAPEFNKNSHSVKDSNLYFGAAARVVDQNMTMDAIVKEDFGFSPARVRVIKREFHRRE